MLTKAVMRFVPQSDQERTDKMGEQEPITTITTANISIAMQNVRNRLWRRSHSLNTVRMLDSALKSFDKYLETQNVLLEDAVTNPIKTLDEYAGWLDKHRSARTVRVYIAFVKKVLKALGAKIDSEEFRELVTLPKLRPLQDEKVNSQQIVRIVLGTTNARLKCVEMLIKDTCARPAEIVGLKLGDFNFSYDPPCVNIPAYLAKNDLPKELFFTPETKAMVLAYIRNNDIKNPSEFLFINSDNGSRCIDITNEERFQQLLIKEVKMMTKIFRITLAKPEFADLNQLIEQGKKKLYKIHLYSFKKFAFTTMADTVGETAARAIKGDTEYVLTYYKKSREERASDYRKLIPKLSVFAGDEQFKIREQVEEAVRSMKQEDLTALLEFANSKKVVQVSK